MYFAVGKPALTKIPAKLITARRGARILDPEIESLMLYRLSCRESSTYISTMFSKQNLIFEHKTLIVRNVNEVNSKEFRFT